MLTYGDAWAGGDCPPTVLRIGTSFAAAVSSGRDALGRKLQGAGASPSTAFCSFPEVTEVSLCRAVV